MNAVLRDTLNKIPLELPILVTCFVFQRETSRTTTSMAMSTARAEATLAVLEAERAQLERRLKRVSAGAGAVNTTQQP